MDCAHPLPHVICMAALTRWLAPFGTTVASRYPPEMRPVTRISATPSYPDTEQELPDMSSSVRMVPPPSIVPSGFTVNGIRESENILMRPTTGMVLVPSRMYCRQFVHVAFGLVALGAGPGPPHVGRRPAS